MSVDGGCAVWLTSGAYKHMRQSLPYSAKLSRDNFADRAQWTYRKINFTVHEACVYVSTQRQNFMSVNFAVRVKFTKNCENYVLRKFSAIWYVACATNPTHNTTVTTTREYYLNPNNRTWSWQQNAEVYCSAFCGYYSLRLSFPTTMCAHMMYSLVSLFQI